MGKCPFQEGELGWFHLQTQAWPLGTKGFWVEVVASLTSARVHSRQTSDGSLLLLETLCKSSQSFPPHLSLIKVGHALTLLQTLPGAQHQEPSRAEVE